MTRFEEVVPTMMRKRNIKPKAVWTPEDAWRPGGPFSRKEPLKDERLMQIAKLEARIGTLTMKIVGLKISALENAIADRRRKLEPLKELIEVHNKRREELWHTLRRENVISEGNPHWQSRPEYRHFSDQDKDIWFIERQAQVYGDAIERFKAEIRRLRGVAEGRVPYFRSNF